MPEQTPQAEPPTDPDRPVSPDRSTDVEQVEDPTALEQADHVTFLEQGADATPTTADEHGPSEPDSGGSGPDSGESGLTEAPASAKVKPSRRFRMVLGGVLAVGLVGAAVAGTFGYRIAAQQDATINPPDQVGTLRRNTGAEAQSTAEYLRDALSAEVDVDNAVGAVYTDSGRANRNVLFFGGTTLLWKPERGLDTAFSLITDNAGSVTGLHDVPAGKFGGIMRCGTTASTDGDIAVCGWADYGSVALAMFPSWTPTDAAPVFLSIRNAAQSRS